MPPVLLLSLSVLLEVMGPLPVPLLVLVLDVMVPSLVAAGGVSTRWATAAKKLGPVCTAGHSRQTEFESTVFGHVQP
jgi:hypothetical protein